MDLTIDNIQSHIEVTPSRGGSRSAGNSAGGGSSADGASSPAPTQDTARLLAALRPLVLQIVREELEEYARIHG